MGISVSASTAIIVAGLFFAFTAFYPVAANGFDRVTDATHEVNERALEQQNTDVSLVSAILFEGEEDAADELVIEADNDGSAGQVVSDTTLLVDNEYVALDAVDTSVSDGEDESATTDLWLSGETLTITLTDDALDGDVSDVARVVLVTESGVQAAAEVEPEDDEENGGEE
ncbi:flagellin [Halorubrum vacuolatum]|uniref:Flagellar protein FlaF n=1 Tax=Halorubrum vacuolatum TaxID=63740 RepID=A0A238WDU5_HALVU|nr:flagellin [Halorubrum vacuolatum]SNR44766.1 flagellar protein FlaF [Halorubrum vacuolatum]